MENLLRDLLNKIKGFSENIHFQMGRFMRELFEITCLMEVESFIGRME
jgi:hypothetical protein